MRKWCGGILAAMMAVLCLVIARAAEIPLTAESVVLMEKTTGEILYAHNEHERLEPASVTKVMTLLLTMEAIDSGALSLTDTVTVSAYASSMGGSQVFLAEGEHITVEELVKSVCVSSGNDAAVALAEAVAGVTELFVEQMNNRAAELGMKDSHFANPTGLPAEGHVTSAYDIALMSRELLLHHPTIRQYTTIWMDTIRNGTFSLSNTNKLVRYYDGCTGLKTGYTAQAGYCISATAEKEGMELIAVVMKGTTADARNNDAKTLLNYGFSTYALTDVTSGTSLPQLPVSLGCADTVPLSLAKGGNTVVTEKSEVSLLTTELLLPESVMAPVAEGEPVGELLVRTASGREWRVAVLAAETVVRKTWWQTMGDLVRRACFMAE